MDRRTFIKYSGLCSVALIPETSNSKVLPDTPLYNQLPRWRGFNLLEKQNIDKTGKYTHYLESDFEMIADLGFDLVRLPLDYQCWVAGNDPYQFDDKVLGQIDQAVHWARQYNIHVSLNIYHAPGYLMGQEIKPSLWQDEGMLKLFIYYWQHFAERYEGIPSRQLSFHLINEPAQIFPISDPGQFVTEEMYEKVVKQTLSAIRKKDPYRLIIVDGLKWAQEPIPEFVDLQVAQSAHWFEPQELTLFHSPWLSKAEWAKQRAPSSWPYEKDGNMLDKEWLYQTKVAKWKAMAEKGVGIQVSAWGIVDTVPHEIALNWMRDSLELFKQEGCGWALWNLRGVDGIGFLDTNRKDITYENYRGHKLDRKMLELLLDY